jgi:hypothetical protein
MAVASAVVTSATTKVLVIPVFRRHWLYHAWQEGGAAQASSEALDWRNGKTAGEKLQLLGLQARQRVRGLVYKIGCTIASPNHAALETDSVPLCLHAQAQNFAKSTWTDLEKSKEGTFKNWLYRQVSGILSGVELLPSAALARRGCLSQ